MSSAPTPSAPPPSNGPTSEPPTTTQPLGSELTIPKPDRKPLLRLELRDLSSSGSRAFLRLLHASTTLEDAVNTVLRLLYSGLETKCIPPTRSITLVVRSMGGVAYTTGLDLDNDHKEIHFSTDYISHVAETRLKEEMQGVIVHEMVHCWQHNALGSAPGGLIEGIADWVRLKAGFAPPHWRRRADSEWDAGYERTGYFLEWLEDEHGADIVRKINEGLRGRKYEADEFWEKCCGKSIEKLWEGYKASLASEDEDKDKDKKGEESKGNEKQEEKQDPSSFTGDDDVEADTTNAKSQEPGHNETTEDTRSARVKARRGGNMHVPVRPGTGS